MKNRFLFSLTTYFVLFVIKNMNIFMMDVDSFFGHLLQVSFIRVIWIQSVSTIQRYCRGFRSRQMVDLEYERWLVTW